MHLAAMGNTVESMEHLVAHGASVNVANKVRLICDLLCGVVAEQIKSTELELWAQFHRAAKHKKLLSMEFWPS